jgi:polyisoprenoid-binding protein YceI
MQHDRAVTDLESFLARRGEPLLRTAVLLTGSKEAGEGRASVAEGQDWLTQEHGPGGTVSGIRRAAARARSYGRKKTGPTPGGSTMTSQAVEIPGYIAGTWDLDPVHSTIGFVARHLMVSKVRGRFTTFEAQIVTAPKPLESSATATIDLSSVDTGNEMRDNDLRSENFFDAATHPTMTYRSTGIRPTGGQDSFLVDGELTIRGVTRPITLTVEVNGFGPDPYGGTRAGFSAQGEIDRTEFGITFNAPVPGSGGVMVSERIQIEIEAEAVLRQQQG